MRCLPHRVVLVVLCAGACTTPAVQSSTAKDTTPASAAKAQASTWREMTWSEYYTSVMQDAYRRGATVIWIDPPQVHKVTRPTPVSAER